jgi:dolichol-phosphate mannosyltransferase
MCPPGSCMSDSVALVVIPTYDERENLSRLVAEIFAVAPAVHVLVVDDNSPDGTGELADGLAAGDDRVHVMHRPGKLGLGTAYLDGFRWALRRDYPLVCEMDADFSHQPRHLPDLLQAAEHADLVLGTRYMPGGGTVDWTLTRKLTSRGGNLYARTILGLPYRDLTGGFKCFRRDVLMALDLDAVRSVGYAFQIELTWRVHRAGFRIAEVPIVFPDRGAGRSKMSPHIVREAMLNVLMLRLAGGGR